MGLKVVLLYFLIILWPFFFWSDRRKVKKIPAPLPESIEKEIKNKRKKLRTEREFKCEFVLLGNKKAPCKTETQTT